MLKITGDHCCCTACCKPRFNAQTLILITIEKMINQAENKTDQVIDYNSDARKHEYLNTLVWTANKYYVIDAVKENIINI